MAFYTMNHNGKAWYRPDERCGDIGTAIKRALWAGKFAWGNRPTRIVRENNDGSFIVVASIVRK